MQTSDDVLRNVLTQAKTIAIVGFSANPVRPSHYVAAFLQSKGYRIVPVNPGLDGQVHLGERVYAQLGDIPFEVDMVDIFRASTAVPGIIDEALKRWPDLQSVWMQLGIVHEEAASRAQARGVTVVMDRCPRNEIPRLGL